MFSIETFDNQYRNKNFGKKSRDLAAATIAAVVLAVSLQFVPSYMARLAAPAPAADTQVYCKLMMPTDHKIMIGPNTKIITGACN